MLADLIKKNRSYRRFHQTEKVSLETLRELVNLVRCSPSGGNKQPLKFILSCDSETNAKIFPALTWAAHLKGWGGPKEGERPAAYIAILGDREIALSFGVDHGIAAQSILLGAVEKGLGGCILGALDRQLLRANLAIPERYDVLLVIAIGKPNEQVVIDPAKSDGDTKYWRDEKDVHHVPKRSVDELILQA